MLEALIGLTFILALILVALFVHKEGLHLSPYEKAVRSIEELEGFQLNPKALLLKQINEKPVEFSGFALDDRQQKLLCFNKKPGLICDYNQLLEWRILVNNRTVASLSSLSSVDLKVLEPDKNLSKEEFLQKYCNDQRQDPCFESVTMKFLIRDLGAPVHQMSMQGVEQTGHDLEQCLAEALTYIDKFKIVMYRGADAPVVKA